jgi:hypothetical protein
MAGAMARKSADVIANRLPIALHSSLIEVATADAMDAASSTSTSKYGAASMTASTFKTLPVQLDVAVFRVVHSFGTGLTS